MNEAENIENHADPEAKAAEDAAAALEQAEEAIDLAATKAEADEAAEDMDEGEPGEEDQADEPDELEAVYAEVADLKDKLLRAMAETENIRRRSARETAGSRKYAITDFARDMLAVADNLQRALAAVTDDARDGNPELSQLLEGVEITRKELKGHFGKHGFKELDPMGEKLDPNLHQAVVQLDDPEATQGTIIQVMQPGYVIHDRLLRAAMVGVAKGAPASNGEAPVAEVEKAQEEDPQT